MVAALRSNPQWTIGDVFDLVENGELGRELGQVTVGELFADEVLAAACRATGEDFDRIVLAEVRKSGEWVGAGQLRQRVGGPRWKLQASCRRLTGAGLLERHGVTSETQHRAIELARMLCVSG